MSGPIIRSGPSPEFSRKWDSVFGKAEGKKTAARSATSATERTKTAPGTKKAAKKAAAQKPATLKPAAKKKTKKKAKS